jgi:hypothetical protein
VLVAHHVALYSPIVIRGVGKVELIHGLVVVFLGASPFIHDYHFLTGRIPFFFVHAPIIISIIILGIYLRLAVNSGLIILPISF